MTSVIFVIEAKNDVLQEYYLNMITSLKSNYLVHRCLFYETNIAKIAIIRQCNPSLHIEYDINCFQQMKSFIKKMIYYNINNENSILDTTLITDIVTNKNYYKMISYFSDILTIELMPEYNQKKNQ